MKKTNEYHELFSHPSEQGVRGIGPTKEKAFEQAAKAMQSVMVNIENIEPKKTKHITLEEEDHEQLFLDWLTEILYLFDIEDMIFNEFKVKIKGKKLEATLKGEKLNPKKHEIRTAIKATTYDELKLEKTKKGWIAQCIVDI